MKTKLLLLITLSFIFTSCQQLIITQNSNKTPNLSQITLVNNKIIETDINGCNIFSENDLLLLQLAVDNMFIDYPGILFLENFACIDSDSRGCVSHHYEIADVRILYSHDHGIIVQQNPIVYDWYECRVYRFYYMCRDCSSSRTTTIHSCKSSID